MLFRMIYDDKLAQAAYLIGCQRTGEALVVDPERDIDRYIEEAVREGLRITAIAETHIHADFLSGARELAERTGATLYLSDEGGEEWRYGWLDKKAGGGSYPHRLLHGGDTFMVGNIRIEAVHTPGHTAEHLSFMVSDLGGGASEPMGIITGDFVFVGDVGRPDLLESAAGMAGAADPAARALYGSLREFEELPDYLQVWPGHGAGSACGKALGAVPQSTVGYEKRFNGALRAAGGDVEEFIGEILEGQPEPPPYFARMKRENRDGPALLGRMPAPPMLDLAGAGRMLREHPAAVVLDTRSWADFRDGHLPGALHTPLNRTLPTIAGSYVEPDQPIVLVVDEGDVAEAVVALIRIGLDRIEGYITPAELEAGFRGGEERERADEVEAEVLREIAGSGDVRVIDVRSATEFAAGHLPGALNFPHTRLSARLEEIPATEPLYVHCQAGSRSAAAVAYLRRKGRPAINVRGGFARLSELGVPTVTGAGHPTVAAEG